MRLNWGLLTAEQFKLYEILCPTCKQWSALSRWMEINIPCETCGDHEALMCPNPDCMHIMDVLDQPEARLKE